MFRGSSNHSIDKKGRIIVPSRFRKEARGENEEGVVITRMDDCLLVFPLEKWLELEKKITSQAKTSDNMRRFRRVFIGSAHDCVPDKQDRILIPPKLREYAGLEKDIVMAGVGDHFEIHSRLHWETETGQLEKDLDNEEARNEVAELGI